MTPAEVHRFARLGAEARLAALEREKAAIYQAFPNLRQGRSTTNPYTAGVRTAVSGVREAVEGGVTRRRPKMSLEARERIAAAQRKRWAEWKAKQGTESEARASAAGGSRKKK